MFHVKQFEKLSLYAQENNLPIGKKEQEQFQLLCSFLLEKNKQLNLTAINEPDEVETKHFIDSLLAAPVIRSLWDRDYAFRLIDVGTGAGFPGLPLKIVFPKAEFVLLDSLTKRINYVNETIHALELENIRAISGRVEEIGAAGSVSRETFDFCVTRAVADTAVLAEYCLPLVKIDGYVILYKSGDYEEELKAAEKAILTMGGTVEDTVRERLYGTEAERSLILIRKTKATPDKYPRRPGKPSKSPIR